MPIEMEKIQNKRGEKTPPSKILLKKNITSR